jgi:hypothetical protein
MSEWTELRFHDADGGRLQLPERCSLSLTCYSSDEVREAVAEALEQTLYTVALLGLDLRALEGITMSENCRADAIALQRIPEDQTPTELRERADTLEMARTVGVWRDGEFWFHLVLRAEIGLMLFSAAEAEYELARSCVAHEAGHVEHESNLYRKFPTLYGRPLDCGERSRRTFLKGIDTWSEYAACRSSALFRPEAMGEFEGLFCRTLEESLATCRSQIDVYRHDTTSQSLADIPQLFGDLFITAGYFFGYLDGLNLNLEQHVSRARDLLRSHPPAAEVIVRLQQTLRGLWASEKSWKSVDMFAPVYDLIRELMEQQGITITRHNDQWHVRTLDA